MEGLSKLVHCHYYAKHDSDTPGQPGNPSIALLQTEKSSLQRPLVDAEQMEILKCLSE